ncbi:hypothetical protein [Pseudocolwellia sp. HL-MZ7]|uniref:hypothetical protein n=1 Tax=Pseudocolwellia sp. HL-MZ7 TaxID=3400627 RepID=UPI003CF7F665
MDALEKLAERNRIHSNHTAKENGNNLFVAISLVPVLITYFYTIYTPGEGFELDLLNALLPTVGAIILSSLLSILFSFLIFTHAMKVIAFFIMQCWFTYFWNSNEGFILSFMPLIFTFFIFLFQLSKIKVKLINDRNGI